MAKHPARVEMTRLTLVELVRVLGAWATVYKQPGAVFLRGSFYCAHTSTAVDGRTLAGFRLDPEKIALAPSDVADLLDRALAVLKRAALTKHKATVDLSGATNDELESFVWVAANCRIHHRGQAKAVERIGVSAERYMTRSPLLKLADCAE